MKKTKRYIIAFDSDGDEIVWIQHGDFTVRASSLDTANLDDTIPIIDLRQIDADRPRS